MFRKWMIIGGVFISSQIFGEPKAWYEDVLVNSTAGDTLGTGEQSEPKMAVGKDRMVIVWVDNRNGHPDIYGQLFDSLGTPIGSNIKLNDDIGTADQGSPCVARSKDKWVVVWEDNKNGDWDIYARIFDYSLSPLSSSFRVNDDATVQTQCAPTISSDSLGRCMIAWRDGRIGAGVFRIYAQRYDETLNPISVNFDVAGGSYSQNGEVSVGLNDKDTLVVVWTDAMTNAYFRVLEFSTALEVTPTTLARVDTNSTGVFSCPISDEIFYILTSQYPHGMYGKKYNLQGDSLTSWVQLYGGSGDSRVNGDISNQLVVSINREGTGYSIEIKRFDLNLTLIEDMGAINPNGDGRHPCVKFFPDGRFAVAWWDGGVRAPDYSTWGFSDVYFKIFDSTGIELDFRRVNDDGIYMSQCTPAIASTPSGKVLVAYEDARKGKPTIYGRIFQIVGTDSLVPQANDFLLVDYDNDRLSGFWQNSLSAGRDRFVVAWQNRDHRMGVRVYDTSGVFIQDTLFYPGGPSYLIGSSMNSTGKFIGGGVTAVASGAGVLFQGFSSVASPIGDTVWVTEPSFNIPVSGVSSALNDSGTIAICWEDSRDGRSDIWAQLFDFGTGDSLTNEFRVHNDISQSGHFNPDVAIDDSNRITFVWDDMREGDWNIYARRFKWTSADLDTLGASEFRVNEYLGYEERHPSVAMTTLSGDFAITWHDFRDGQPDIYAKLYNGNSTSKGVSFRINRMQSYNQLNPVITGNDSTVAIAWMDTRNGNWDIYAQARTWHSPIGPDGLIGKTLVGDSVTDYIGKNTINLTGANQTAYDTLTSVGDTSYFYVKLRNREDPSLYALDSLFRIQILPDTGGWIVEVFDSLVGGNLVTSVVLDTGWVVSAPDSGEKEFRILVTPNSVSPGELELFIHTKSKETFQEDVVRIKTSSSSTGTHELPDSYSFYLRTSGIGKKVKIAYGISHYGKAILGIYDIAGRLVKELVNKELKAGVYTIKWGGETSNSRKVATGVYFVRLCAGDRTATRKLTIIR